MRSDVDSLDMIEYYSRMYKENMNILKQIGVVSNNDIGWLFWVKLPF